MPDTIELPDGFPDALEAARQLRIPNFAICEAPFETVLTYYSQYTDIAPPNFPNPEQHVKIADYLIDAPLVAVDLSEKSEHYGRIVCYSSGMYWVVGDSISAFVERLKAGPDSALWGK